MAKRRIQHVGTLSPAAEALISATWQFRRALLGQRLGFPGHERSLAFWTDECARRAAVLIGGAA